MSEPLLPTMGGLTDNEENEYLECFLNLPVVE